MAVYVKAALAALPGAGRLPFVPGGGGAMPDMELGKALRAEPGAVADYAHVCGFSLRDELPPTYPHVLAFPLHMMLMTDGRFPFSPVGLVHIANRIEVRRPLRLGQTFDLLVRPGRVEEHTKGRSFEIVTEARADGEIAWREESTMLRRGGGSGETAREEVPDARFVAEWRLPEDLGRRYAAVSGDRNPIHMHALTAKAFGFPRAIAHGMWTKARCLAALDASLPDRYEVSVEFRKPILLPGRMTFGREGEHFVVRSGEAVHVSGRLRGLA